MSHIKDKSDIIELKNIYSELINKEYNDSEWAYFNEKLLAFAEIIGKYSSNTKSQLHISTQKLGFSSRDVGFVYSKFDNSIGFSSAKTIMKEVIDSI